MEERKEGEKKKITEERREKRQDRRGKGEKVGGR